MISEKILNPTDDDLRDRVLECGPPLAFGQGTWREYENGVWRDVSKEWVMKRVVTVLSAARSQGVKPNANRMHSVGEMTRVHVSIEDKLWDSDPNILVCRNGTLNIRTGQLMGHREDHYATSGVPYDYDPRAVAPTWERAMRDYFTPDVAAFLQEFVGLALTTDQSQEIAVWLHSPPGGGKSTFLVGVNAVMGDRAGELGLVELTSNRFALARLPGKTLLTATEQPADFMRRTDVINKIISGDRLQVEKKFMDPFDYTPTCKILWAMNELPPVHQSRNGLFRRVKVVKMDAIPAAERDPDVRRRIESEGAGILNWALKGLSRYHEHGTIAVPAGVKDATDEWQRMNDVTRLFLESEWCEYDPARKDELRTQSRTLYREYREYCAEFGLKHRAERFMREEWENNGLQAVNHSGTTYYKGVKVPMGSGNEVGSSVGG